MGRLSKNLLGKSKGAFVLSVELYNKPTIAYRNESFSMLFTNAWELLLKAKIYEDSNGNKLSIFRRKLRNEKRQSITIDECLDKVFTTPSDPIKNNIQFISELRNEATHLVIDEFDPYYSRVFQSGVLSYLKMLREWFSIESTTILPPGFLALISAEQLPNLELIRKNYTPEDFKMLLEWEEKFRKLEAMGGNGAISVQHQIALVKNPKKADVVLSPGGEGTGVTIIERTRDVDETHPHRAGDVLNAINSLLTSGRTINGYDLQAYLYVNGVKSTNNDYHWKTRFNIDQYSQALIAEIFQSLEQDPSITTQWRKQYSSHQRQRRS